MKKFFLILILAILLLSGKIVFGQFEEAGLPATSTPNEILSSGVLNAMLDESCSAIICDDFNSYTEGNLNGQGSWIGSDVFDIVSTTTLEGAHALEFLSISGAEEIIKTGNSKTTGQQTAHFKFSSIIGDPLLWRLYEGATGRIYVYFDNGTAKYSDGTILQTIGTYSAGSWFYITIEWRASDHLARYFLNGVENPLSWDTPQGGAWVGGLDTIKLQLNGAGTNYVDYFAEFYYGYEPPSPPSVKMPVLDDVFFVVDYIFGDLPLIYFAFLIIVGIVFSFVYQLTKR